MKEIKLTQSKVAKVDDEDFEYLNQWKWQYNQGYAVRSINFKKQNGKSSCIVIRMHRFILGLDHNDGRIVDHKDCDTLNNQKQNLRECTNKENSRNSRIPKNNKSGIKGVYWYKPYEKWRANIKVNGKLMHLGYYSCKIEASNAYNTAALIHHGEFARLNEIPA